MNISLLQTLTTFQGLFGFTVRQAHKLGFDKRSNFVIGKWVKELLGNCASENLGVLTKVQQKPTGPRGGYQRKFKGKEENGLGNWRKEVRNGRKFSNPKLWDCGKKICAQ